jgi:SsrA-binding protein
VARKSSRSVRKRPPPSPDGKRIIASNRKARHDYVLLDRVEAGLVLTGSEVKSLRTNGATIREGYARVEGGELWLRGVHIPPLPQASYQNHEPTRPRKCLVHRRELRRIEHALEAKGLTMVPLALYFLGVRVKVDLALARGRRKGDRRAAEREKEDRLRMRRYTGRQRGYD